MRMIDPRGYRPLGVGCEDLAGLGHLLGELDGSAPPCSYVYALGQRGRRPRASRSKPSDLLKVTGHAFLNEK